MCLAQGHNTVKLVRLEPAASWSGLLKSSTLPLSHCATIIQYLAKGKKELIFNHLLGIMLHPRVTHI